MFYSHWNDFEFTRDNYLLEVIAASKKCVMLPHDNSVVLCGRSFNCSLPSSAGDIFNHHLNRAF